MGRKIDNARPHADYMRGGGADCRACTGEFLSRSESRLPANGRSLLRTIGDTYERLLEDLRQVTTC